MKVPKQNTLQKFIATAEAYLEPREISTMELVGLTIFSPKSVIIDFLLGSKYASVMEEDTWR